MSRNSRDHLQTATYTKPSPFKLQRDASKTLEQLANVFTHLRDTTLPRDPYLVSVPSNVPYNHSRRYIPTWHNGTPFTEDEEQLQYLSFVPPAIEDTLLCVVGGWSDEKGNLLPDEIEEEEASPASRPTTRRNSPSADIQRKKISLGQYKNKVKGEVEMTTDTPPRRDMEKQTTKVNGVTGLEKVHEKEIEADPGSPGKINGKKHPRDNEARQDAKPRVGNVSNEMEVDERRSISPRPSKKPKLEATPLPTKVESQSTRKQQVHPSSLKDKSLPGLLSPTLPPKMEEESLPPLLSPTIPPSVLEFLNIEPPKLDKPPQRARTDSVRNLLATAGLGDSGKSPTLHPTGDGNRVRSDSAHSARSSHSANGLNRVAALAHSPGRASTPTRNGASPGPRQRHTIILKYGKRNRKLVEALLKFPSRPKRVKAEPALSPPPDLHRAKSKLGTVRDTNHSKDQPKEGRSDPAAKHQKTRPAANSVSEKDVTPGLAAINSPPMLDHQGNSRSTFSTPKKDLKSTAMQRVVSSDENNDARTPQADRLSTPQPSNNRHSPSAPTSAPSASSTYREEWTSLGKKYFELGRKIKKEGTSYGADATAREQSLALVLMVEGLLCFMINTFANSAAASSRQSGDPGWRSIIPYLDFVLHHTRKQPYLNGLAMQLGALCRQFVHKHDIDRLAKEALPDDPSSADSAPTPGSDGNTRTGEDTDRAKQRYLDFRDQLISNTRRCQAAWLEGSRLLSPETLREEFPVTWKRRAIDFSLRGMERPLPRELGGSFFLPLDGNASPLEGVRYAVEVLQEWCEREEVPWRCRIEL